MTSVWARLTPGRVVRLADAWRPPAAAAPAIVTCRLPAVSTTDMTIEEILLRLDAAARGRYPAWLPGAEAVVAAAGTGAAAVRALARRVAADGPQFGPFLADLAERSLRYGSAVAATPHADEGRPATGGHTRFPAEVRAVGLARVLAVGAGRPYVVLHVVAPPRLPPEAGRNLVAACEWLAYRGRFAVALSAAGLDALTGPPVSDGEARDRPASTVEVPDAPVGPAEPTGGADPTPARPAATTVRRATPPTTRRAGGPHPRSRAEQVLERALGERPWAAGREWNAVFRADSLAPEYRIDLMWRDERCAVEIDGPEHRDPHRYEADRRRDTELQLEGFAVLRFTNRQVLSDVTAVVADIEKLINSRRQKG